MVSHASWTLTGGERVWLPNRVVQCLHNFIIMGTDSLVPCPFLVCACAWERKKGSG